MTPLPFTDADIAYVSREFVLLDDLCAGEGRDAIAVRRDIAQGLLPRPSYVLPDGGEMVPADLLALADGAGGPDHLRDDFRGRLAAAAAAGGVSADPDEEWDAYLSGEYGVCLREVTPEAIVQKSILVARIEQLVAAPKQETEDWESSLRFAVDELDRLERPFAPHYDLLRFGMPSSRDRLITATRSHYPHVFDGTHSTTSPGGVGPPLVR